MSRRLILVALIAGLLHSAGPTEARKKKRQLSKTVEVSGRITDAAGQPLGSVEVVLEAYHRKLDLRRMKRRDVDLLRVVATTGKDGRFQLEWARNDHYQIFYLATALPVRRQGRDELDVFSRLEISAEMRGGSSVRRDLTVEDAEAMRWLQRFLAGMTSAAEQRVYQEMGRPDRIDAAAEAATGESAWWYFAAGKVYRFKGGEFDQVIHFEPINSQ